MISKDQLFMTMAYVASMGSHDKSTSVGCVFVGEDNEVLSIGFNGFVRGADDNNEQYHQRPLKYDVTEHAERNAIYNAARIGVSLKNSVVYVPWLPCSDCMRGIIQVGAKEIVVHAKHPGVKNADRWKESNDIGIHLINTNKRKINIRYWDGEIQPISILWNGTNFNVIDL
jgi:dCMP deaminase